MFLIELDILLTKFYNLAYLWRSYHLKWACFIILWKLLPKVDSILAKSCQCIEIIKIGEDRISKKIDKYLEILSQKFPNAKSWVLGLNTAPNFHKEEAK